MMIVRTFVLSLLTILALLPNLMSSMAWGAINIAFAFCVVGTMLFLGVKKSRIAKFAIAPLAAILTLPPYPYWIFMDNGGVYHFVFNRAGIRDSIGFFSVLFVFYAVIFFFICLITRRNRAVADSAISLGSRQ